MLLDGAVVNDLAPCGGLWTGGGPPVLGWLIHEARTLGGRVDRHRVQSLVKSPTRSIGEGGRERACLPR